MALINLDFTKYVPMLFPIQHIFIDNGNNALNSRLCYPKPNANGYLVFFKPDSLTLKPVMMKKNETLEESTIVILDDKGSIPSDITLYFDCYDENGVFELYDIWVYRSSFDPTSEYKPCSNCDNVSLIEILKNQPYYAVEYFNSETEISSSSITNLVKFGQLEKSLINLPSNEKYKYNQVRYQSEAISENIFYNADLNTGFDTYIDDYIFIKDFLLNEFPLESQPKSYLNIKASNKTSNSNELPLHREIAFRFGNATTFDGAFFTFSFCCKNNDISIFQNFPLELYIHRVFGDPSNPAVTIEMPFKLDYVEDIVIQGNGWNKISRVCNVGTDIVGNMDTSYINEVYLSIRLPNELKYSKYDFSFTNFFVGFTTNKEIPYPHIQSTISVEEQWPFTRVLGKNAIYSPIGIVPEFPSTAGRIIDYLWVDKKPIGDKPTSIVADGRVIKVSDYYEYPNEKYINRIPYSYLFEAIGYGNGSGSNHFNAWSTRNMTDFPDPSNLYALGDVLFHWNYKEFMPHFDKGNCGDVLAFNFISAGCNPYGTNVNDKYPININFDPATTLPINIEASFCYNRGDGNFSISYLVDSNVFPYTDINLSRIESENIMPFIRFTTYQANTIDLSSQNNDNINEKTLFSANENFYCSYGRVGGYKKSKLYNGNSIDINSLPSRIRNTIAKTDTYNILYQSCYNASISQTTSSSISMRPLFSIQYGNNFTFPTIEEYPKSTKLNSLQEQASIIPAKYSWSINIHQPKMDTGEIFTDGNELITAFITKFQLEMKCALMIRVKDAMPASFKTKFQGKYFIASSRYNGGKRYCFWFQTSSQDLKPNVVADVFLPINIILANSIASFCDEIEKAVNSYIIAIPNLQDAILYSVGNGYQTSTYGKEDVNNYALQDNNREALQGSSMPSSSNNFINKKSFFEALNSEGFASSYGTSDGITMKPSQYKNSFSAPRIPVIRHISLV